MKKLWLALPAVLLLSILLWGTVGAQGWSDIWSDLRLHNKLWVNSTSEFDGAVVMDSTLAVTGAQTLTGNTGIATGVFGTDLRLTPATVVTLTQSATLAPTGVYQPIAAAGNLSFGTISGGTAGDVLYLINTSNTTITMTDTGTLVLSGNAALAQYDTILLISDGTNWYEVAQTNN